MGLRQLNVAEDSNQITRVLSRGERLEIFEKKFLIYLRAPA